MRFTRILREGWYAELRRALGGQAMEVLVRLKSAAGRVRACSAEGLAALAAWEGDPQALAAALERAGIVQAELGGWSVAWPWPAKSAPANGVNGHGTKRPHVNGHKAVKANGGMDERDMRVWYGVLSQRIERAERLAQETEDEEERTRWQRQARLLKAKRNQLQGAQAAMVLDRLQQPRLSPRP
jgi:hypothetical protein